MTIVPIFTSNRKLLWSKTTDPWVIDKGWENRHLAPIHWAKEVINNVSEPLRLLTDWDNTLYIIESHHVFLEYDPEHVKKLSHSDVNDLRSLPERNRPIIVTVYERDIHFHGIRLTPNEEYTGYRLPILEPKEYVDPYDSSRDPIIVKEGDRVIPIRDLPITDIRHHLKRHYVPYSVNVPNYRDPSQNTPSWGYRLKLKIRSILEKF